MIKLTILGSTGSIGVNTLAVVEQNPEKFDVFALAAGRNVELMAAQCLTFNPRFAAMSDLVAARRLRQLLQEHGSNTEVLEGDEGVCTLAGMPEADQVMAAIVGASGLLPTLSAIRAGKRILLANKESLVTCGRLFLQEVQRCGAELLPVDSEHNAIFQCLPQSVQQNIGHCDLQAAGVENIILTGSGGPFRTLALADFAHITPEQACAHPNWSMGRKISVDSATMMNKGLEYIEARWLFNASATQMEVIVHPQSIIHSMVRFSDGSVIAQMGNPDMRTPIGHCMAYPERTPTGVARLDFSALSSLHFEQPDMQRYPCLQLAIEACNAGQMATTALNAANEISVEAFLQRQLPFTAIAQVNRQVIEQLSLPEPCSVDEVLSIDHQARVCASQIIAHKS
ncbi:1-deoxy-D-xylulose-5-phosphate reductoisomerase [Plesiomonas sp.]|uniref:1-deoxy-D-xylulose-5-phosphate reductoisomerase n=1 Tax=Plesiomonas sp. TaxID=2486279 RepID=UPI003F31A634